MQREPEWWRRATVYHIYVRSFQDSNADGRGDIPGILQRLDTLCELGVDALWLSPFYPSPQADFGYDVADYREVDPVYGTLEDLAALRDALHQRGKYLILDLVPNHTSDQHEWFAEACRSRTDPKRNWYMWADPGADGSPPNNWISIFGGSAWRWHEPTGQFYLHCFLTEQPDLNWAEPQVVDAVHDVMRWWFEWGADGFRVDAIPHVAKDPQLRDNPPDPEYTTAPDDPAYDPFRAQLHVYDGKQPEALEVVAGLRAVCEEFDHRVLIGETALDWKHYLDYVGDQRFQLAFSFHQLRAASLPELRDAIETLHQRLPASAQPTLALSNHDVDRHVTRLGRGEGADDGLAKATAAMLLLGPGTPFVYQGEEIGMPNVAVPDDQLLDPVGLWERERGHRLFFSGGFRSYGRDPERTPMHWSNEPGGGFTSGEPWLPMGDLSRNVDDQRGDPDSVWNWYRTLLQLRREHEGYESLAATPSVWRFRRGDLQVVVGLADEPGSVPADGEVVLGSVRDAGSRVTTADTLAPHEVLVLR